METPNAIQAFWAASAALVAAIPADRFYTGDIPGGARRPYANLVPIGETSDDAMDGPRIESESWQIGVRSESLDECLAARAVIDAELHGAAIGATGLMHCVKTGGGKVQEPHGLWHCWSEFEVLRQRG